MQFDKIALLFAQVLDTRVRSLEKQVGSRDEQIKGFQRDIRRNENATKVLVREKELLVTRLNNADGLHAKEIQSMEEAFAARTLEMSSRLVETTANLEKAQEELELLRKERQSAAEMLELEREAVEKWKAESEVKVGKLEGRVRALESALEEKQDELKVRHRRVAFCSRHLGFASREVERYATGFCFCLGKGSS